MPHEAGHACPPMCWASATAASLPDTSSRPFRSASSCTFLPLRQHARPPSPACAVARRVIRTRSCGSSRSTTSERGHHLREARDREPARRVAAATARGRCARRTAGPARGLRTKRSRTTSGAERSTAKRDAARRRDAAAGGAARLVEQPRRVGVAARLRGAASAAERSRPAGTDRPHASRRTARTEEQRQPAAPQRRRRRRRPP